MAECGILLIFSLALLGCVTLGLSILYALLLGYALFFLYGLHRGMGAVQLLPLWHFYSQCRVKNTEKLGTVDQKGDM